MRAGPFSKQIPHFTRHNSLFTCHDSTRERHIWHLGTPTNHTVFLHTDAVVNLELLPASVTLSVVRDNIEPRNIHSFYSLSNTRRTSRRKKSHATYDSVLPDSIIASPCWSFCRQLAAKCCLRLPSVPIKYPSNHRHLLT